MHKYIIFRAEKNQPGWKERKLQHTKGLTRILAEHFDSSDGPIPEPGYRLLDFKCNENGSSSHYRTGDWQVTKVETYPSSDSDSEFGLVVICYCQFVPVETPLIPMPERQVLPESFTDRIEYETWRENNPVPV